MVCSELFSAIMLLPDVASECSSLNVFFENEIGRGPTTTLHVCVGGTVYASVPVLFTHAHSSQLSILMFLRTGTKRAPSSKCPGMCRCVCVSVLVLVSGVLVSTRM